MAKGIRYEEDTKQDAVARWKAGESPNEIAKELGIHYTTLYDWKMKFKNRKGKRRMTRTKPQITITTMKVVPIKVVEELKEEVAFWKNYSLKLIREKESQ